MTVDHDRKIAALRAKADRTDNPHEAAAYRQKAAELTQTHGVTGSIVSRILRETAAMSDTLKMTFPDVGEPYPGTCWDCGHGVLMLRPDKAMGGATDEVVCGACGETQPTTEGTP